MALEIINGYVGRKHITSEQDRIINRSIYGNDTVITSVGNKMEPQIISNNEIRIRDGAICQQGCFAVIPKNTYVSLTVTNGSQGMKRISTIFSRYQKDAETGVESMDIIIRDGTPVEEEPQRPAFKTGDISNGDILDEFPIYDVILDGLNITEIKKLSEPVMSMANAVYYGE